MVAAVPAQSDLHRRFCDAVRERRLSLGMTQIELADRLKVKQPHVAAIESGRSVPSLELVERVAEALSCDPVDLLREKIPA